jgi:hypothetical protein
MAMIRDHSVPVRSPCADGWAERHSPCCAQKALAKGLMGQEQQGAGVSDLLVVALETPSPHVPQVVLRDVGQP